MKKFKLEKISRRQVTLVALVILIAIAGYVNISYQPDAVPVSKTEEIVTEIEPKEEVKVAKKEEMLIEQQDELEEMQDKLNKKEKTIWLPSKSHSFPIIPMATFIVAPDAVQI